MEIVTISPKFQVVIPQKIRNKIGVKPGQKMHVITYDNQVVMIPVRPIQEARGSLKGINTDVPREEEERV
jgi:AbrB family looped-hinge helix DNA binding protein